MSLKWCVIFIWGLWQLENLNSSSCTPIMVILSSVNCLSTSFVFSFVGFLDFFSDNLYVCTYLSINPLLGFDVAHISSQAVSVSLLCLRCPELKNNSHFYIVKSIRFVLFESCLKCFLTPRWQRFSPTSYSTGLIVVHTIWKVLQQDSSLTLEPNCLHWDSSLLLTCFGILAGQD